MDHIQIHRLLFTKLLSEEKKKVQTYRFNWKQIRKETTLVLIMVEKILWSLWKCTGLKIKIEEKYILSQVIQIYGIQRMILKHH